MNVEQISYYMTAVSFSLVILCWCVFAGLFIFRKKPESSPDTRRAPSSFIGIALQGVGFALVWGLHRTPFLSPVIGDQYVLNIILQVMAVLLAIAAVWTAQSAIRELGKQWSLQARLVEGHRLVTTGIYSVVRHPI